MNKSGSKFISETFKAYEVDCVFFVEAIFRDALREMAKLGIKRVMAHNEKAAAYMADGYARASRKPGIVMCQSVGAANLAAGLQDAFLNGTPVIGISGHRPPLEQYRNPYQEIYHPPLFQSVTKFHCAAVDINQLPHLLPQLFREASAPPSAPVHMDVAGLMGEFETDACEFPIKANRQFLKSPAFRPVAEEDNLKFVLKCISESRCPVIIAGGGIIASGAEKELIALAEKLSIPVITSVNGKGALPGNHRLNCGVVGTYTKRSANLVAASCDLAVIAGSRAGDLTTDGFTLPPVNSMVIQIDIDPIQIGRNYPNTFGLVGDVKATLAKLFETVDSATGNPRWLEYCSRVTKDWESQYGPMFNSKEQPTRPERLCQELSEFLPPNAVLVADTGHSAIWAGAFIKFTGSNQKFYRAAGSLGWAFPAAMGIKCATPERPVFCFTGDGGICYHLSELETALRCGINTVTIVNNNNAFGQCWEGIHDVYGDDPGRADLYLFKPINFANFASDMGCLGIRIEDPTQIRPALERAVNENKPALLDVVTDWKAVAPYPPMPPQPEELFTQ